MEKVSSHSEIISGEAILAYMKLCSDIESAIRKLSREIAMRQNLHKVAQILLPFQLKTISWQYAINGIDFLTAQLNAVKNFIPNQCDDLKQLLVTHGIKDIKKLQEAVDRYIEHQEKKAIARLTSLRSLETYEY